MQLHERVPLQSETVVLQPLPHAAAVQHEFWSVAQTFPPLQEQDRVPPQSVTDLQSVPLQTARVQHEAAVPATAPDGHVWLESQAQLAIVPPQPSGRLVPHCPA